MALPLLSQPTASCTSDATLGTASHTSCLYVRQCHLSWCSLCPKLAAEGLNLSLALRGTLNDDILSYDRLIMVLLCSYLDLLDKSKGQVQLQGLSGALREGSECPRAAGTYCWEISAGASHA
ncbi:hypothetical protein GW17_00058926 [Ensete ventricosum]|nr:hypothetical protein GW17_00058926 [Ensete ventricosum]